MLYHHKFTLAFENSVDENYISEKLWQALKMGTVPVYWVSLLVLMVLLNVIKLLVLIRPQGAPNVRQYAPDPNAVILFDDFSSVAALAYYLREAMQNETLYNRHLRWKERREHGDVGQRNLAPGFARLDRLPGINPFCGVCDAAACAADEGGG